MEGKTKRGIFLAILAAALYAISTPVSKVLLVYVPPRMMAGFLYVGAGLGMVAISLVRKAMGKENEEQKLSGSEMPYIIGMVVLDIVAPILLMMGLMTANAANVSLLNNFEIVVTAIIAAGIFKEKISPKLWVGIALICLSCSILSVDDMSAFTFSSGSALVLLAACAWGLENNCTRKLSLKDPLQIVLIKGIFSGLGALIVSYIVGERMTAGFHIILFVLLLGFVAYGLSIFFYVYAQRVIGAAKTSAYYAVAPFIGVVLSLVIFREVPGPAFFVALVFMVAGAVLSA